MQKHEENLAARINGNNLQPLAGATVTVTNNATGLAASLYQDDEVTPITSIVTDNNGYYGFKAPDGEYTLTFSGVRFATFTRQLILDDPSDNPYATLAQLASPSGTTIINYGDRPVADKLGEMPSAEDFGAAGDGETDDWAAIQGGLDELAVRGGNANLLTSKRYRITKGLKFPSTVGIIGPSPVRYPYNNAAPAPALVLDFTDANQWGIEPKTTSGGNAVPYNTVLSAVPDGLTFNCSVRNLLITSVGVMPYGAIRMHGCPGAVVKDVGIVGTSTGLFVNECFGGEFVGVHTITPHYGAVAWGESNANVYDVYCTQGVTKPDTVPSGYLFPELAALNGNIVGTLGLATEAHYNRPFGMLLGSTESNSASNEVGFTSEYFSGGVFMFNAKGVNFTRLYVEGAAGEVDYAIVAANSNFLAGSVHPYLSSTGTLVDIGVGVTGDLALTGILSYANFGNVNDASSLTVRGAQPEGVALPTLKKNIQFPTGRSEWITPTLANSWADAGGPNAHAGYRVNQRTGNVELKGYIFSGGVGSTAFVLPAGYRPLEKRSFPSISGTALGYVIVLSTGEVIPAAPTVSGDGISLDGITFRAEQ